MLFALLVSCCYQTCYGAVPGTDKSIDMNVKTAEVAAEGDK